MVQAEGDLQALERWFEADVTGAVGVAFLLRGYGGGRSGSEGAQGDLRTEILRPDQR